MQLTARRACRRALVYPGYQRVAPRDRLYQPRLTSFTPIRPFHPQNGGASNEPTKHGKDLPTTRGSRGGERAIDAEKERREKIRTTTKEPWNYEVLEKAKKARGLREANVRPSVERLPTPRNEEEPLSFFDRRINTGSQQSQLRSGPPRSPHAFSKFRLWRLKCVLRFVRFLDRCWARLNNADVGRKEELHRILPYKHQLMKNMDEEMQKYFKIVITFLETCIRKEEKLATSSLKCPYLDHRPYLDLHVPEQQILQPIAHTQNGGNRSLDLPAIDRKWQSFWENRRLAKHEATQEIGKKMYILPMFPYPSGDLHLGHLRVYTISDVLSRFRRMQGYNVLHPIGWDAFGLPAENAAIERGIDPATWTATNIQKMKSQLKLMNGHWDWDREFATSDPKFYGFTQYLFHELHAHDLVYQKESLVNYDPVDKTVLANEQVDSQGYSWRSGAKVEKRMLKQWFLRITAYRQELLDSLKVLQKDGAWPDRVLAMQKNWLGKSSGARIKFSVGGNDHQSIIEVFTTRPDTLFGVQYLALASTYPLVQNLAKTDLKLQAFLDSLSALPEDSKVGYLLPAVYAVNPLAEEESTPEAVKAHLPIYVAPYVLGEYGDGAVMGVPGHDTRDYDFWKHNRKDDQVRFVLSSSKEISSTLQTEPVTVCGHLNSLSGRFAGLSTIEASAQIMESLTAKDLGSSAETWRLRDWLISRQRYWGTPVPIIHCRTCGPIPVPLGDLPVKLPPMEEHWERGKTGNPLEHAHDWINASCPKCGADAKRDTDTMDTFVDSSWYFMRFVDPKNEYLPFSIDQYRQWLPVDLYIGGIEHAILHLLYARFFTKFLATYCEFDEEKYQEPFKRLLTQGMVHGRTYSDPLTGRFLKPDEVDLSNSAKPLVVATGEQASISFEKMSKSKYNGVDPGTCIAKYGADATRAHMLFQAPVGEVLEWDENKISGVLRWMRRIHEFISSESFAHIRRNVLHAKQSPKELLLLQQYYQTGPDAAEIGLHNTEMGDAKGEETTQQSFLFDKKMWRATQGVIIGVNKSLSETYALNTVISDLMRLTNFIIDETSATPIPTYVTAHAVDALIKMMAPITPAFAEECWQILYPPPNTSSNVYMPITTSVFDQPFPEEDGTYDMLIPDTIICAVQINGKFKTAVEIPIPDPRLDGKMLENWMVRAIMDTEQGRKTFGAQADGKKGSDLSRARKLIIVGGGKTVNFVI